MCFHRSSRPPAHHMRKLALWALWAPCHRAVQPHPLLAQATSATFTWTLTLNPRAAEASEFTIRFECALCVDLSNNTTVNGGDQTGFWTGHGQARITLTPRC
ncbi:hypothetical protein SKAU_G00173510 [Synaphobranchus kaupii]|uniref:Uncharacterized protein n=1 Tax=Synaphobranchus kaupii TaxID=118154 RepID=A0A9Q1J018_SYNKA|nr:hypothetical protein SKAU_G00173510 [Synaphobranchus kaupii]